MFQLCASEFSASHWILLALPRIGVDPLCGKAAESSTLAQRSFSLTTFVDERGMSEKKHPKTIEL